MADKIQFKVTVNRSVTPELFEVLEVIPYGRGRSEKLKELAVAHIQKSISGIPVDILLSLAGKEGQIDRSAETTSNNISTPAGIAATRACIANLNEAF